jgi:predicted  nucleic acid-binding Zn-ribbon protein
MNAKDMNATNSHKHKCPECGFVWQHSNAMRGNQAAHQCPCGGESFYHYFGEDEPDVRMCGRPRTRTKTRKETNYANL